MGRASRNEAASQQRCQQAKRSVWEGSGISVSEPCAQAGSFQSEGLEHRKRCGFDGDHVPGRDRHSA
eukprot:8668007-Prorocentrum_lima.AAC.1